MTREAKHPSNLISLDKALTVVLSNGAEAAMPDGLWGAQKPRDEHLLQLQTSTSIDQILTHFHEFHTGTKRQSIIICTPSINASANLIAFAALETGFRVFLVILELREHVTPEMLRLSQAGVSVMNLQAFQDELALGSE